MRWLLESAEHYRASRPLLGFKPNYCVKITGRTWGPPELHAPASQRGTAGLVSDGDRFVTLVAHIVSGLETIELANRPVAWFMAGAGLLDIGDTRRRGLELPLIKKTYWPHGENFKRLEASTLDFRLLCPGPMVEGAAVGLERLRVAIDRLFVQTPAAVKWLPDWLLVPIFASRVPEMIIPYADAAALMLNNLEPGNAMSRHRVGLALPVGMKGKKERWTARAP
jgi:hypothetical protein